MRKAQINCPAGYTLLVLSGMWKVPIVFHLLSGSRRFGELRRQIGRVTQKVLVQQLRELERDGVISRREYPVVPPRVEYTLTELGLSLRPVVQIMCAWGAAHAPPDKAVARK